MNLWRKKRYNDKFIPDLPNFNLVESAVDKLTATNERKNGFVSNRDSVYPTYTEQKIVLEISMHAEHKNTKHRIVFWPKRAKKVCGFVSKKHKPNKYRVPKRTSPDVSRKY